MKFIARGCLIAKIIKSIATAVTQVLALDSKLLSAKMLTWLLSFIASFKVNSIRLGKRN